MIFKFGLLIFGLCLCLTGLLCSPLIDERPSTAKAQPRVPIQQRSNKSQQTYGTNKNNTTELGAPVFQTDKLPTPAPDHWLPKRSQQNQAPNCNDDAKPPTGAAKSCRINNSRQLKESTRDATGGRITDKSRRIPDFSHLFQEETKDYPEEEIRLALQKTPEEVKNLFNLISTPLEPNMNLTERIAPFYNDDESLEHRGLREESICRTVTRNIYPRQANRYNSLVYVPNDQEFVQVIQAEICESPDEECNYLQDSMPYGMSSVCKQKYSYKKLLYLDPLEKRMSSDLFRYPSCCSCYIRSLPVDLRSAQNSVHNSTKSTPEPKSDLIATNNQSIIAKDVPVYTGETDLALSKNNEKTINLEKSSSEKFVEEAPTLGTAESRRQAKGLAPNKNGHNNSESHTVVSHEDKVFLASDVR